MTPLTLHPNELQQALSLKPGETLTLARPVEPQPVGVIDYIGVRAKDGLHGFKEDAHKHITLARSPFGPVGSEFFIVVDEGAGVTGYPDLHLIHKGTEVNQENGQWLFIGRLQVKGD